MHEATSCSPPRAFRYLSIVNTLLFTIYYYWLSTYRSWHFDTSDYLDAFGGNFYWLQASSMLKGQLHLTTAGFECLDIEGNCHGYFGPFPSLLRIPFVMTFGDTYDGLSPIFLALAAGIALYSFTNLLVYVHCQLITRALTWFDLVSMQVFIFALGISSLLIVSAHPRVYEESMMWSVAFVSVAINLSYRWFVRQQNIYLFLVILCGCAGVLSKVTALPFFTFLGLVLVFQSLRQPALPIFLWGCAVVGVPLVTYLSYTLVHLGFLGFDAKFYWPYNNILIMRYIIDSNDGNTLGLQFFPTVITNQFRLNNIIYSFDWPFIEIAADWPEKMIYVWPMKLGQIFTGYSPGVLSTVPGTFLFGTASFVYMCFRKSSTISEHRNAIFILYAGALANVVLSMSYFAINARYLTDVYPLMSLGIIILASQFFSNTPTINKRRKSIFCVILLCSIYSATALAAIHADIVPFL